MAALADLGREIGEIAERVGPSVVGIGNRWRGGSGVVIGENRILTNAHNLHGDEISITFADGRNADATVVGVDADGDLAVLEAPTRAAPARSSSGPMRPASARRSWRSATRTGMARASPSAS